MAFQSGSLILDLPFDAPLRYDLTLTQTLNRRLGPNYVMDPKDTNPGDYIRVTTLNAGTGLENLILFLVGLHELFEEEQSLRL